jgi:hypothetical protein
MDCYHVEWKGPYHATTAHQDAPAGLGLYCVYMTPSKVSKTLKKLWYVGQSKDVRARTIEHSQQWASGLPKKDREKLRICFGIVHPVETNYPKQPQVRAIEGLLIVKCDPVNNSDRDKQAHSRKLRPLLIVNTGTIGTLPGVVCYQNDFLTLLGQNLKTKKRRRSTSW